MATILKTPQNKGVVVFTTQERDNLINKNPELKEQVRSLKDKWVIGLHHNWHDTNFRRDHLYDFSMAGKGDLQGDDVPLVELDACNFAPDCFYPNDKDKHWDILYVARTVFFKRTHVFFNTIKKIYDTGYKPRVLLLTPVKDKESEDALFKMYNQFSLSDRSRLTLVAPTHDYPFPYDIETLAFYYRHSRVFAHFADEERRCRVVAYAAACGLPVVCRSHPASIIPSHDRNPPNCYIAKDDNDFPSQITTALMADSIRREAGEPPIEKGAYNFSAKHTVASLKNVLERQFNVSGDGYKTENLDIRLGRHLNLATGSNRIPLDIAKFVSILKNKANLEEILGDAKDPEIKLSNDSTL